MSQLVRLEGKHTAQTAHCAVHLKLELNLSMTNYNSFLSLIIIRGVVLTITGEVYPFPHQCAGAIQMGKWSQATTSL